MKTNRKRAGLRRLSARARRRRISQYRLARGRIGQGPKKRQGLIIFGTIVTMLYVVSVPWLYFGNLDFAQWLVDIRALQLNAYGGFLVGAVGPLALLWLTLAVIQQGQELSIQIAELKNSVEQRNTPPEAARRSRDHGKDDNGAILPGS